MLPLSLSDGESCEQTSLALTNDVKRYCMLSPAPPSSFYKHQHTLNTDSLRTTPPPWSTTILVHGGRFRSLARPSSNIFVIYHTFIRVSSAIKCPKTSYYYWRPGTSLGSLQRSQTQLLICWEKIKMLAYLRALSVIILSQEPCLSLYTGPSTCACNTVYMY